MIRVLLVNHYFVKVALVTDERKRRDDNNTSEPNDGNHGISTATQLIPTNQ